MKKVMKKSLCALLALAMVCTGLVLPGTEARADDNVPYIDESGARTTQNGVTALDSGTDTTWEAGWYIVKGSVTYSERITVSGAVHLILADNCTLTASKGISVKSGNSLTIYAQSEGNSMGKLVATGKASSVSGYTVYGHAAIGGNNSGNDNSSAGTIIINGGDITATADKDLTNGAAGIGGGAAEGGCGNITINGGKVTATGGKGGAGIGVGGVGFGYAPNCSITINGGTIVATGYDKGPGIGGNTGSISITGGNITANAKMTGTNYAAVAAGIGSGSTRTSDTLTITISGGLIHAQEDATQGYGIGGSNNSNNNNGTVNFSTGENGNAVIYSRGDLPNGTDTNNISCVYYRVGVVGNKVVYGSPAPTSDFEVVKSGDTLTVPEGAVLIIPDGVTLTNNGTIENNGHVIIEGSGKITGSGSITKAAETGPAYGVSVDEITFTGITYGDERPEAETITIKNIGVLATTIQSVALSEGSESFELTGSETGELANRNDTNTSWKIQPNDNLGVGTYSAMVTVTYTGRNDAELTEEKNVSLTVGQATATVTKPEGKSLTYNGEEQALVEAGSVSGGPGEMQYSLDMAGEYSPDVPKKKDVGSYTVYWKIEGADEDNYTYTGGTSGTVTVSIEKSEADVKPTNNSISYDYGTEGGITLEVTVEPKNKEGIALTSAGVNQVEFDFPKGDNKIVDLPTGEGKATVKIEANEVKNYFNQGENTVNISYGGSGNLNEGSTTIKVTVNKKQLEFTFKPDTRAYEEGNTSVTGTLNSVTEAGVLSGDNVTASAEATVATAGVGEDKEVTVVVTLGGTDKDYYEANAITGVKVNISKADASVTKEPVGNTLDYNGGEQELITAGTAEGGELKYILSDVKPDTSSGDWKTDAADIKGQEAQTYTIWYYVEGDKNHNSTEPESVTATISKAASEVTKAPTANELTYTGSEQELVTKGTANGGTMQYALSEDENQPAETSFTGNIPMGTEAKTYYVWYKVKGDKDHEDTTPVKVTAEIKKAASNVTVAVDKETHTYGDEITLTANIAVSGVETSLVNGQVTFKAGTAELGTATAANGTATVTIQSTDGTNQKALFDNSTQVTAEYSGNDNINTSTSVAKSVTVKQKELTFKFNAEGKTYNNDTTVNGEFEALTGQLLPGDVVTVNTYTAKTDNPNVGTEKTVTVEVTELGGDAAKYYTPGAATSNNIEITKAESSMSGPTGKNDLVYDGKDQELIQTAGEATGGSMMYYVGEAAPGTDDGGWKGAIADIKGKGAGTYTVWYYVKGDDNHNNTEAQSITVEIEKKEVGLTWNNYDNLTYTGEPQNVTADFAEGAIVEGDKDKVSIVVTNGDKVEANPDSTYTATAKLNGDRADNYTLSESTKTKDYTIGKATVKFEIDGESTFTYDTEAQTVTVKENEADTTKLPGAGSCDVLYTANESEASTDGTANKINVGAYGVWVKLSDEAYNNYMFEGGEQEAKVGTMTIKQAELKLEVSGSEITYGDLLSESELKGKATIGEGTVISGSFAWDATDGAKYPAVADSGETEYTVKFTPDSQYQGNFTTDSLSTKIKITVNKKELTPVVVASSVSDKIYDGNTSVADGTLTFDEDLNKEPFSGNMPTATGSFEFVDKNVGTNKHVNVKGITLSANPENYQLNMTSITDAETTAAIKAKMVTLTWKDYEELIYSGTAKNVTATISEGKVETDDLSVEVANGNQINANKTGEQYTAKATLTGTDAGNYTISNPQQEYTIAKSVVSFEEHNGETTYDTKPHQVTLTNTADDAPALQTGDYTVHYAAKGSGFDGGATDETKAGEYDVWVQLSEAAFNNYEFEGKVQTYKVGTLTVKKADLELTVNDVTITYGDALANDLLNGSTAKITGEGGATITGTWAWESVGAYPTVANSGETEYKVTFTPDPQFAGNFVEATLNTQITITVNKKELTPVVVASSVGSRDYDGTTDVTGDKTLEFTDMSIFDRAPFSGTKPTISGTFAFTSPNAGTNTVNVTGIEFASNGDNYSLSTNKIDNATVDGSIQKKMVELTWALDGESELTTGYDTTAHAVTATATTGVEGETVNVTVENGTQANAGTYTAKAAGLTDTETGKADNYKLPESVEQEYTITPAEVSFTIGDEYKVNWSTRNETNDDPNPEGYKFTGEGTDYALTMTYDSFWHAAEVKQTEGEKVTIEKKAENGYCVTYKRVNDAEGNPVTEDAIKAVRNAGTYEIWVTINPVSASEETRNYVFEGHESDTELKIGEITVKPYEITVAWTHLSYVYHGHPMHPNITVLNAFKNDLYTGTSLPTDFDPDTYKGNRVIAFGATGGSDVGEYTVTAKLYGANAGNYTVTDPDETVTIVPAPVTFTVGDNIWVIDNGTVDHTSVTLRPTWGAVTTDPDTAVHDSYPKPGTAVKSELNTTIVYKKDGVEYTAPTEAGTYEVWVTIGNGNFRHSATSDGASHNVGELIITTDRNSVRSYTVTFDPDCEGATGPEAMTGVFANQTVVMPAIGFERQGHIFQGWSYGGRVYMPNEEFHMPSSDVTFKAQWLDMEDIRSVGGTVKQEQKDDPTKSDPVLGATVTLKQGSNEIGETVTDAEGNFSFGNLVPGIYNLEVRYHNGDVEVVKTYLVDVEGDSSLDGEYVLPGGALNTVVEADVTAVVDLESIVKEPSASEDEGIYTNDDAETVNEGGSVEFKMTVKGAEATPEQIEEIPVPEERIGMVLDMDLTKTVTDTSGSKTENVDDTKTPITTVIHLPLELQGKSSYTIYRFHDLGDGNDMQTITTSENENGEYLKVIREGTAIELHARLYSTYVLTWAQRSGGGGGSAGLEVELPESVVGGKVSADRPTANPGDRVTLTVTASDGFAAGEVHVYTASGVEVEVTVNDDGTYSFTMPNEAVVVTVGFGVDCKKDATCPIWPYTDAAPTQWYHDGVHYVLENGIMDGYGNNIFKPSATLSRAMVAEMLYKMNGRPAVTGDEPFDDVDEGDWYRDAVIWANANGYITGYGDGTFRPETAITREQLATIMLRYERKHSEVDEELVKQVPSLPDAETTGEWYVEGVNWAVAVGIIGGRNVGGTDYLLPASTATRAEAATMVMRWIEKVSTKA